MYSPSSAALASSYTALSTLFIAEVRIVLGATFDWSESTPIAQMPASLHPSITPRPVPPAAWKITSALFATILLAAVLPAPVSAKLFTLFCKIVASLLASLTPARYPYPNSFIVSVDIPITRPTVFDLVVFPAT